MSNKKNATTVKANNATNVKPIEEKSKALTNANLSSLVDSFKNVSDKTAVSSGLRETHLYKYAENGIAVNDLSSKIPKNFRTSRRKEMQRFCGKMKVVVTNNDVKAFKELQKEFSDHYAKYYTINDYSLGSVTNSRNELERQNISALLNALKTSL